MSRSSSSEVTARTSRGADGPVRAPASLGQRMLWALARHSPDPSVLNLPVLARLRGPLPTAVWRSALNRLVAEHETLRTTYEGGGHRLRQVVHPPAPVELAFVALDECDDPETALSQAMAAELASPIDPTVWPLRATLWRVGAEDHVLCLNLHHLATDTTSNALLFRRLVELARTDPGTDPPSTAEPSLTYREFTLWQQKRLSSPQIAEQLGYWTRRLSGVRFTRLPRPGADTGADPGGTVSGELRAELTEALRDVARTHSTTLFTVLLAIHYTVLHATTGQRDLTIASVFANRGAADTAGTVGFLANLLVLRSRIPRAGTFVDLLREVHDTVSGVVRHQEVPYHLVPRPASEPTDARADEVVFQMINDRVYTVPAGPVEVEALVPDGVGGRFGLEIGVIPVGAALRVVLLAAPGRFPAGLPASLLRRYLAVAALVARSPAMPLQALAG
ncbi:condensation domain-containing protein [Saccharomonospora xinjiangensis]|uniref:condensation domain-containing protein n=1 Tax=Saccharomonospora xinjiangensis TaxID=75294 RepID=UPI0010C517D8|nr:condensation domain-containing protein [Saccharomonospora xinjiangensis]QBQ60740.1 Linear gramicidin synthase subunit B [Saccharomonospora xinjiangensis]